MFRIPSALLLVSAAIPSAGRLAAQEPPPAGAPQQPRESGRELRGQESGLRPPGIPREQLAGEGWPFLSWRHATGAWGGVRSWLEENGILPEVFLTTDASVVAAGGADPGGTALRALVDATVTIDTDRAFGLPGGQLFVDYQLQRGADGSLDSGDLQVYSNIDGPDRSQVARVWYEQVLFDRLLRVKAGKIDVNSDFAYVEQGFRFINSSFGFSPTILGLPSYPDSAFGALTFVRPGGGTYLGAGVFDGATQAGNTTGDRGPSTLFGSPSDLFAIGEAGLRWHGEDDARPGRLGLGVWRHTGDFLRFDGGEEDGTDGLYLVFDQIVWRSRGDDARREVGVFFQYGWADPEVSAIENHVGAGAAWTGPFGSRPDDAIGLGLTYAAFSDAAGADLQGGGELAIELFYTIQVTPFLRLKPDVQWIHNPGGEGLDDALVLTLRTAVSF